MSIMDGKQIKSLQTSASSQDIILNRFSDLPDDITSHIFSLLTIRDLTGIGVVCEEYTELPLSSLFSLSLDELSNAIVSIYTNELWKGLLDSLDRFLVRGCKSFLFKWDECYYDQDKPQCSPEELRLLMIRWINNVGRCKIEIVDIKIDLPPSNSQAPHVALPSCAFLSESLRHLSLKGLLTDIKTPTGAASLSNLQSLKLRKVHVTDESFCEWISHSCQCLTVLELKDVDYEPQNATLESSSLQWCAFVFNKDVSLSHLYIKCEKLTYFHLGLPCNTSNNHGAVTICAPNLTKLKWNGGIMNCQNLGELSTLKEAQIELDHSEVNDIDNVFKLFWTVRKVKHLVVNNITMQFMFIKGGLTPALLQLDDVGFLRIRDLCLMDDQVPALVSLLNSMPNLSELHIEAGQYSSEHTSSSFGMSQWKSQNLAFMHQLKNVTVELSEGTNGINFTRYILDHALNLQRMTISHLPEQYDHVRRYKWPMTSDAEVAFHVRSDKLKRSIISIGNIYDGKGRNFSGRPCKRHRFDSHNI